MKYNFISYFDGLEWIEKQSKKYNSKNEFYASEEYKEAYSLLKDLHNIEKKETSKLAAKEMEKAGVKYGDRVFYDYVTPFGVAEEYSGTVVEVGGLPRVKLDPGQKTITNSKSVRWHKGFKKINSSKLKTNEQRMQNINESRQPLTEFNIKNLKFFKIALKPQQDLDRSKIALGFASFLYSKLLGQLSDQTGAISTFFVKSLNANYSEFLSIKKKNPNITSFQLKDFKYPYLGLIFYRQNPETIVDAESITLTYFNNVYSKYIQTQRELKVFNFYNYFAYFDPKEISKVKLSEIKKLIKPTRSPKYNAGKIDLTTVFISNYLDGNLSKEFNLAIKDIKNGNFKTEPVAPVQKTKPKTDGTEPEKEEPKKSPEERLKPLSSIQPELTKSNTTKNSTSSDKSWAQQPSVKKFYDDLDKNYSTLKDDNPPRSFKMSDLK